jgi:cleavage and polyadenylation specificity factor subunit 3
VKKGKVLLPTVSLGRAQELLLLLEQFWERNPRLHQIPIYQISTTAALTMPIYQTFIEMMNDNIKREFKFRNPFQFKHIFVRNRILHLNDMSWPCVVLAPPSTIMAGISRDLLDRWCEDDRNNLILTDFAVQGTVARELMSNPKIICSKEGKPLKVRLSVDAISFSAHADFKQTAEFLNILKLAYVILVHGEKREIDKLSKELSLRATLSGLERHVYSPNIGQSIKLYHKLKRTVKVIGRLAEKYPHEGLPLESLLIKKGNDYYIIHPSEASLYTSTRIKGLRNCQFLPKIKIKKFKKILCAIVAVFEIFKDNAFDERKNLEIISIGRVVRLTCKRVRLDQR